MSAESTKLLQRWLSVVENCAMTSGVCCCGDSMQNHPDPMVCGHSPVDSGAYAQARLIRETRLALTPRSAPSCPYCHSPVQLETYVIHNVESYRNPVTARTGCCGKLVVVKGVLSIAAHPSTRQVGKDDWGN